jgi:outer membrane protein assembly factor BamE (lipoprotein component of BamABCDE complex)
MQRVTLSVCLLMLLVALACTTRGRRFSADDVPRIRPGVTTQEDVRRLFGAPASVRVTASGGSRWSYVYEEETRRDTRTLTKIGVSIASIFGARVYIPPVDLAYETRTRHRLDVWFDGASVVEDYTYEREDVPTRRVY